MVEFNHNQNIKSYSYLCKTFLKEMEDGNYDYARISAINLYDIDKEIEPSNRNVGNYTKKP